MRRFVIFLIFLGLAGTLKAQLPPKLVVYISVDQMRADYLFRFRKLFTTTGLLRMESLGRVYRNHHYSYVPTYTGPGHATLSTGTWPYYHGIVANDWFDREVRRKVYCVEDASAQPVGTSHKNGQMSPVWLRSSTLGDELKLAYPEAKSVAIALKDRAAILMAGHSADGVYWFDESTGRFVSSTFYTQSLPAWLEQFNGKKRAETLLQDDWTLSIPEAMLQDFGPDESPYEMPFKGHEKVTFPYPLKKIAKEKGLGLIKSVPGGNTITFEMAQAAIEGEGLGQDYQPDLLHLSFSATDYCGHQFGPRSLELADMYRRFDEEMTLFLNYLDQTVGKDEYVVVLSADHGVADNPHAMEAQHIPAGVIPPNFEKELMEWCHREGAPGAVLAFENLQIYFDYPALEAAAVPLPAFRLKLEQWLHKQAWVQDLLWADQVDAHLNHPLATGFAARGYGKQRSGDLMLLLAPGYVETTFDGKGATHGSHYAYDTHVPLIVFGKGMDRLEWHGPTRVVDIAPSVASLLQIRAPNASVGKVLPGF